MIFLFFFATFFRKDIVEWNNAMSQKSNLFPNQNAPSHKKIQNMETKKTKQLNVKKNLAGGIYPILSIFENTETQIYRINSICGKKSFIYWYNGGSQRPLDCLSKNYACITWKFIRSLPIRTRSEKEKDTQTKEEQTKQFACE